MTKSSSYVTYGSARHHGTEGTNLCYFICAIFTLSIFNNFITPIISVVHINIGSRRTFWVEETLKRKFVLNWVYVCNSQYISSERARHRSSNGGQDTALT